MEIRKTTINPQLIVAIGLIIVGAAFRLVPHLPNITPIGAIALFGGAVLGWRVAVWLPLVAMIASDLFIGFYPGIAFTWAGFLLVALYGMLFKNARLTSRVTFGAIGGSLVFFVASNFGVWVASGMYAHTYAGLVECYAMALPFFRMSLMGDIFYSFVIFGIYAVMVRTIAQRSAIPQNETA